MAVDCTICSQSILESVKEINQLLTLKDPCSMLLAWSMYIDGYLVVGNSPEIKRVVNAHNMHEEDLLIVESYPSEYQDNDHEGDEDYVTEIIKKNQLINDEPDELS
jgi:hypothetical protein